MKIVLLESLKISPEKLEELVRPFLQAGHTFCAYERSSEAEQVQQAKDADVIIIGNMPLKEDVLSQCFSLKMIDVGFTGLDHVDLDYARKNGITVCNAAGYSTSTVAELVVGNAISLMRHVRENEERCRGGQVALPSLGIEIGGKAVGIVGFGAIGSYTAKLFHAFGCRILAYMPHSNEVPDYVESVSLEELLRESDIVSLHCPFTPATAKLIGAKELASMKSTAILVNAARGGVVDTEALSAALNRGQIGGAVVDVFDKEPPLEEGHPLMSTPNTLLTPHIAYASEQSMIRRADIVFENLRAWLDGKSQNVKA